MTTASSNTLARSDRASVFELAVAPRARFPFAIGKQWGAAYVQLALGFGALDIPAVHSVASGSYELVPLRASTDTAFMVGASVGVQLLLSPHAGLVFDLGWQHHFFSKKMSVELIGIDTVQTVEADADYDGGQLMLSAGPLFAF